MAKQCFLYWYKQSKPDKYGRYYWKTISRDQARKAVGTRRFRKMRTKACKAFEAKTTKDGVRYAAVDRDMAWRLGY